MTAQFLARHQRFDRVGSTNDVVRDWLADGTAEVCLAVADEQTAGRGRSGRRWQAPAGGALLLSLGFRPTWIAPDRVWQLAATASLAMARAASAVAGLADGTIRLKWPNDLVVETEALGLRKLGGVLGETVGLGTDDPRVIVGIGLNADWRSDDFPAELAGSMTSLRQLSADRPIDTVRLLDAFVARLADGIEALRDGRFDAAAWSDHQLTNGRSIRLERPDGAEIVHALGVDTETGGLVVADPDAPGGVRQVLVGEISHVRLASAAAAGV
jgi:BirA family transcriptional regulator, biotin operon repressor / biotin---[acetyl-CoA-carboxylase] ligase